MSILVVGAEKGGVGKSSLAVNILALSRRAGIDAVLLDGDKQQSARRWAEMRAATRETDPSLPQLTVESIFTTRPSGDLAVKPVTDEVDRLSALHPLVIVDLGAGSYTALVEVASSADLIVVPSGVSDSELVSTEELVPSLLALKRSATSIGPLQAYVALTRVTTHHVNSTADGDYAKTRLADSGIETFAAVQSYRGAWAYAGNTGKALYELGREGTKAAMEFQALYDQILGKLVTHAKGRKK